MLKCFNLNILIACFIASLAIFLRAFCHSVRIRGHVSAEMWHQCIPSIGYSMCECMKLTGAVVRSVMLTWTCLISSIWSRELWEMKEWNREIWLGDERVNSGLMTIKKQAKMNHVASVPDKAPLVMERSNLQDSCLYGNSTAGIQISMATAEWR